MKRGYGMIMTVMRQPNSVGTGSGVGVGPMNPSGYDDDEEDDDEHKSIDGWISLLVQWCARCGVLRRMPSPSLARTFGSVGGVM